MQPTESNNRDISQIVTSKIIIDKTGESRLEISSKNKITSIACQVISANASIADLMKDLILSLFSKKWKKIETSEGGKIFININSAKNHLGLSKKN